MLFTFVDVNSPENLNVTLAGYFNKVIISLYSKKEAEVKIVFILFKIFFFNFIYNAFFVLIILKYLINLEFI